MKHYQDWHWAVVLGLLATPALAANKCIEESGRIFYQAAPCPPSTRGGDMRLNINQPFTGQAKPPMPADVPAGQDSPPGNDEQSEQPRPAEERIPPSEANEANKG